MLSMDKHYMRIIFGMQKDGSPEIYDFLFRYLPKILTKLKFKKVSLDIERLESLDAIYTNLDYDTDEIKNIFSKFIKSHNLHKATSLTGEKDRTSIKAELAVDNLPSVFKDYNTLFDIFFTS